MAIKAVPRINWNSRTLGTCPHHPKFHGHPSGATVVLVVLLDAGEVVDTGVVVVDVVLDSGVENVESDDDMPGSAAVIMLDSGVKDVVWDAVIIVVADVVLGLSVELAVVMLDSDVEVIMSDDGEVCEVPDSAVATVTVVVVVDNIVDDDGNDDLDPCLVALFRDASVILLIIASSFSTLLR